MHVQSCCFANRNLLRFCRFRCRRRRRRRCLSNGNGNKTVILKYNFSFLWLFRDYSNSFNMKNAGELSRVQLLWTVLKQRKRKKNLPSYAHVLEKT